MNTIPAHVAVQALDITKVYGSGATAVTALDGVTAAFTSSKLTAIMGPSGSGKSTLMHCLAGLDDVTSGRVELGGEDLSKLDDKKLTLLRRERLGFVFQAFNLVPTLTADENIRLPLTLGGRKPDPDWYAQVIASVGLADRLDHRPAQLSGGQQQRVAVARALLSRPEVIFADEPTGNLDTRSSLEVRQLLRRAVDDYQQTVVMVTHDPTTAADADEVVFLQDGRIVDTLVSPTADAIFDRMATLGA